MVSGKQSNAQLGYILAFVAGAVNAGGFLAIGYYTSHMTGIASSIADSIALNKISAAMIAAGFLVAFILGAITTTLIVNYSREKKYRNGYGLALILEGMLLLSLNFGEFGQENTENIPFISILCFIMGLQNAVITKISNATIRTTHITGLVTDIGIEIGRYLYQLFSRDNASIQKTGRLGMYTLLVLSFLVGGVAGAFSFNMLGVVTTIPLAFILFFLTFHVERST